MKEYNKPILTVVAFSNTDNITIATSSVTALSILKSKTGTPTSLAGLNS